MHITQKSRFAALGAACILLCSAPQAQAAGNAEAKKALAYAQYGNSVVMAIKSALATQKIYMTEREMGGYKSCLVSTVRAMMPPGGMKALVASDSDYAQKLQYMNDRVTRECVPRLAQAVKAKYPQSPNGRAEKSRGR